MWQSLSRYTWNTKLCGQGDGTDMWIQRTVVIQPRDRRIVVCYKVHSWVPFGSNIFINQLSKNQRRHTIYSYNALKLGEVNSSKYTRVKVQNYGDRYTWVHLHLTFGPCLLVCVCISLFYSYIYHEDQSLQGLAGRRWWKDRAQRVLRAVKLCMILYWPRHVTINLSKSIECTAPRVSPKAHYASGLCSIMCQCRPISCNECTTLLGMSIMGKAMPGVGWGIWELSVTSAEYVSEPNVALKKK